jgi:hypothetical protein
VSFIFDFLLKGKIKNTLAKIEKLLFTVQDVGNFLVEKNCMSVGKVIILYKKLNLITSGSKKSVENILE